MKFIAGMTPPTHNPDFSRQDEDLQRPQQAPE
jgi:hypothetical protein